MTEPIFLQKARKYNPLKDTIDNWINQQKLDGVRLQACFSNDGDVRIFSRSIIKKTGYFNEYTYKLPHIISELEILNEINDYMLNNNILDGEGMVYNQGNRENNFKYVGGTLNCDIDKCQTRQAENELISATFYNLPKATAKYIDVIKTIDDLFDIDTEFNHISPIAWAIMTAEESTAFFRQEIANGGEGTILYNPEGVYKHSNRSCQVSKDLLKMKDISEREVKVIGMIEGAGKATGMMGALICEDYRGKVFHIGTGFTDAMRMEFWAINNEAPFIIEMLYHSETEDAYRLPVFLRCR